MRSQIITDKEFNIISRSIDNAEKCKVVDIQEDCFNVKLKNKRKYEKGESVELFAMTEKGQLYFETIVNDVNNDILSIWFPISYKYVQRREFSRININVEVIMQNGENNIKAKICNISAGGLKVITQQQLHLLEDYKIFMEVENKKVETVFEPIRIETVQNGFCSSGRFKNISNYDRITLFQYCYMKQIENSNK